MCGRRYELSGWVRQHALARFSLTTDGKSPTIDSTPIFSLFFSQSSILPHLSLNLTKLRLHAIIAIIILEQIFRWTPADRNTAIHVVDAFVASF
ncbi:hypothetical protein TMatcc_003763 [Talaromyces marneffei ATCC 18224]